MFNVPASVIAPVVPVEGVKPVEPALNDVTPPVDAAQAGTPPTSVRTYPFVPADSLDHVFVAEPYSKSPVATVVWPVPPTVAPTEPDVICEPAMAIDVLAAAVNWP